MGRKKPPGARRRGPTAAAPFDEFGNDPRAVMHRMTTAALVVACREEHVAEVIEEAWAFLEAGEWTPPLGRFTLMAIGNDQLDELGECFIGAYGLSQFAVGVLADHLSRHENAERWNAWDALDVPKPVAAARHQA